MSFRFRKSIKIAPGIRVNLSKSGVSTSIGPKGSTVNISKRGVKHTAGIPGTGLSYQSQVYKAKKKPKAAPLAADPLTKPIPLKSGPSGTGKFFATVGWIFAIIVFLIWLF